jgi:hypothetical protein
MTNMNAKPFRRLLRWYPTRWRVLNGDVLLSTMLDAAEREGRITPTRTERWSAVIHGTGAHIDGRLALWSSIAALIFSVISGVIFTWGIVPLTEAGLGWILQVLITGVVPALTAIGLIAIVRGRGLITDTRAIAMTLLSIAALGLAALTSLSWSMGFDAADAGVPHTGLATLWFPLFLAAILTGVSAISLLLESLLQRTTLKRLSRMLVAGLTALIAAPIIGFSLMTPYVSAVIALGVAVLSLTSHRNDQRPSTTATPKIDPPVSYETKPTQASHLAIRLLAAVAMLGGVLGVIYALTGAQWSTFATDGTIAMAQGIILLLLSAVPLLAAFGLTTLARGSLRRLHIWGPLGAGMISLGFIAIAYLHAPEWEGMALWFTVASVLGGAGITWWTIPRVRLARPAPILIGVFAGLLYAAFLGMMLIPMLAFTVPVLAVLVATLGTRPTIHQRMSLKTDDKAVAQRVSS